MRTGLSIDALIPAAQSLHLGGYRQAAPPLVLAEAVECRWMHAIEALRIDERCQAHLVLPDPGLSVAFMCRRDGVGRAQQPRLTLIGPVVTPRPLHIVPGDEITAVKLFPEWAVPLLGVAPHEHADSVCCADGAVGVPTAALLAALSGTRHWSEASRLLVCFIGGLYEHLPGRMRRRLRGQDAAAALRSAPARQPVVWAAEQTGVSLRQFRRLFASATGFSPKRYSRSLRFNRLLAAADRQVDPDWAGLAAAAGYSDQAHLVHEFRALTGRTPAAVFKERRLESLLYCPRA